MWVKQTTKTLSVQVTCTNQVIRVILAYGPQENASKDEKDKFYDDLNIEVLERAKLCGEQALVIGDLNANLGHQIIKNDVYDIMYKCTTLKRSH